MKIDVSSGFKLCTSCNKTKPLTGFWKSDTKGYVRYLSSCIPCKKASDTKRRWSRYGVDGAAIWELKQSHSGFCDICGVAESEMGKGLAMDHDHETQEFRGFLCGNCNQGIGKFKDDPKLLQAAIEYLRGELN